MENIIKSIGTLFTSYGFQAAMIIIATIIITNLIKKPIVKRAVTFAEKSGYDKSVVTKNITFIPVAVAFVLVFLVNLIIAKFQFTSLNWTELASTAVIYAAVSTTTYEGAKKQLEAYASKKNAPAIIPVGDKVEFENAEGETLE